MWILYKFGVNYMMSGVDSECVPSLRPSYEEWKKKYKVDDADDSDGENGGGRGLKFGGMSTTKLFQTMKGIGFISLWKTVIKNWSHDH